MKGFLNDVWFSVGVILQFSKLNPLRKPEFTEKNTDKWSFIHTADATTHIFRSSLSHSLLYHTQNLNYFMLSVPMLLSSEEYDVFSDVKKPRRTLPFCSVLLAALKQ